MLTIAQVNCKLEFVIGVLARKEAKSLVVCTPASLHSFTIAFISSLRRSSITSIQVTGAISTIPGPRLAPSSLIDTRASLGNAVQLQSTVV